MSPLFDRIRDFFKGVGKPAVETPAPPTDDSIESVQRWLVECGLGEQRARALAALALPAVRLRVTEMAVDDWPALTSKLGGAPDVPAGFAWPELDGEPIPFVAQVKLADLARGPAASALPADGVLSFFCHPGRWGSEPHDRGSARVFWFPDPRALRRMPHPASLPPEGRWVAGRLATRAILTLPDPDDLAVEAMQLTVEEEEIYAEVALDALRARGEEPAQHQLLGHPEPVQGEMQLECERVTNGLTYADEQRLPAGERAKLAANARQWRLLAQVDTDGMVDMMWGDAGMLYFWITEADLAARRFDRTWMILQCS